MTSAWFLGAQASVPQTENEVRSTVEPIRNDPQIAEADSPPAWNEEETSDSSGELVGLSPRVEGSYTVDSEQYPVPNMPLATAEHNDLIDRQVATSGTAAAREAAGEWGHGTAQYEIGIMPLNPGEHYGNERFQSLALTANEGSGDYMEPVEQDNWLQTVAQATATQRSRDAYNSTLYANYFESLRS